MIDDARLCLQPFRPARLANLSADFLPQLSRQRRVTERGTLLPTTGAFDFV